MREVSLGLGLGLGWRLSGVNLRDILGGNLRLGFLHRPRIARDLISARHAKPYSADEQDGGDNQSDRAQHHKVSLSTLPTTLQGGYLARFLHLFMKSPFLLRGMP
jgi:hypothetical protein